jgi:RNA polymerase sigma factor (sigma-70 family)
VSDLLDGDAALRARAFDALVTAYWKPVYTYLRLCKQIRPEEAEELTQGFFVHAFEKGTLDRFDSGRARFRTWMRTCLEGYLANERKARSRQKRGGAYRHVSLDFASAEGEVGRRETPVSEDPERFFHREWMRGLLGQAVEELERESAARGRALEYSIFERYDLEGLEESGSRPTYEEVARELGTTPAKVTNALHAMRRRLRRLVLSRLGAVSSSEEEFRAESRALFGVDRS